MTEESWSQAVSETSLDVEFPDSGLGRLEERSMWFVAPHREILGG